MKTIQLDKGMSTMVDDEDFDELNKHKWFAKAVGRGRYYATRAERINGKVVFYSMHRVIMKVTDPKIYVDHKDRIELNNQKYNLRTATHQQNQQNQKKRSGVSSKYRGVCFIKETGRYRAMIKPNKISIHLGMFDIEEDAAIAYNTACLKHYGEFASLNIIPNIMPPIS